MIVMIVRTAVMILVIQAAKWFVDQIVKADVQESVIIIVPQHVMVVRAHVQEVAAMDVKVIAKEIVREAAKTHVVVVAKILVLEAQNNKLWEIESQNK